MIVLRHRLQTTLESFLPGALGSVAVRSETHYQCCRAAMPLKADLRSMSTTTDELRTRLLRKPRLPLLLCGVSRRGGDGWMGLPIVKRQLLGGWRLEQIRPPKQVRP